MTWTHLGLVKLGYGCARTHTDHRVQAWGEAGILRAKRRDDAGDGEVDSCG